MSELNHCPFYSLCGGCDRNCSEAIKVRGLETMEKDWCVFGIIPASREVEG